MLKLGCFGCLGALLMGAILVITVWAGVQATRSPDLALAPVSAADGFRAQQKLFDLARGSRSGRPRSIELSEREVNGFLARHLDTSRVGLSHLAARLRGDGQAEVAAQVAWGAMLDTWPLTLLAQTLPAAWLEQKAWLSVLVRVQVDQSERPSDRRHLRLDVERFWLGRLPLPELMLGVLLAPPARRLLRTALPEGVDAIRVEDGRLFIVTAP